VPKDLRELTIKLQLTRSVDSFHDLLMVAQGLDEIDNLAGSWFELVWPRMLPPDERYWFRRFGRRVAIGARIKRVEASSPLAVLLQCTPEWIAIYLAVVFGGWTIITGIWNMAATYDDLKRNLPIIRDDIKASINALQGLSERAKELLLDAVDMLIDGLLRLAESELEVALGHIRRMQEARLRLAAPAEPVHSALEVVEDKTDDSKQSR
jgi:hypothetical protein